jgi:hypothetical protein
MLHSQLKRPTISTLFQRPSEGVGKCDFRVTAGGGKKMMAIQTKEGVTAGVPIVYTWDIPGIYRLLEYTWYIHGMYRLYTSLGFQMFTGTLLSHWDFLSHGSRIHFRVQMSSPLLPPNDLTQVESSPKGRGDSVMTGVIRLAEKLYTTIVQNSCRNMSSGGNQDLKLFLQHGNVIAVGIKCCRMITFGIVGFWLESWRVKLCSRGARCRSTPARWRIYMIMSKQRQPGPVHRPN